MSEKSDSKAAGGQPSPPLPGGASKAGRATRMLRIGMTAALVFGAQWQFADPTEIAGHSTRFATPWALMALLPVFALGAWAYEVTGRGGIDIKADLLWGVLAGTGMYLALTVFLALA